MEIKPELSLQETILFYTQTKIDMANKFRKGISQRDFAEFDKKLRDIDSILNNCANEISSNIATKLSNNS